MLAGNPEDFHILKGAVLYLETQRRPFHLPALQTGRSGIDVHQVHLLVIHHLKYMRMSAEQNVRLISVNEGQRPGIIVVRGARNMCHKKFKTLYFKQLKERVAKMVEKYEDAINYVKAAGNNDLHDFLARRLYEMTAEIIMSLLILDDATRAPELFAKSANVYVRYAEGTVAGHYAYIKEFKAEDLADFLAATPEEAPAE